MNGWSHWIKRVSRIVVKFYNHINSYTFFSATLYKIKLINVQHIYSRRNTSLCFEFWKSKKEQIRFGITPNELKILCLSFSSGGMAVVDSEESVTWTEQLICSQSSDLWTCSGLFFSNLFGGWLWRGSSGCWRSHRRVVGSNFCFFLLLSDCCFCCFKMSEFCVDILLEAANMLVITLVPLKYFFLVGVWILRFLGQL